MQAAGATPTPAAAAAGDAPSRLFDFAFHAFRRSVDNFCGSFADEAAAAGDSSSNAGGGGRPNGSDSSASSSEDVGQSSTSGSRRSAFQSLQLPAEVLQALAAAGDLQQLNEEYSSSRSAAAAGTETQGSTREVRAGAAPGARQQDVRTEELLLCMRHCARLAERCAVISPNEELDDIPTRNLKYLLLPYLLGRLSLECNDMQRRLSRMQEAQIYLREFMAAAERLHFARTEDVRAFENVLEELQQQSEGGGDLMTGGRAGRTAAAGLSGGSMSAAAAARNELIARAKYEKQLDAKLATLFHRRRAAAEKGEEEGEEEERELWTSLLARAAAASTTHLSHMAREIPMLLMRMQHEEEQMRRRGRPADAGAAPVSTAQQLGREETAAAKKKPWFYAVRDRTELRQLYRAKVFTPGHNLPTMSLAECAAIEMEMEVNQIGARKKDVVREYPTTQTCVEAEEEEERQQREWDNWKDEHPRGSGNKMRNKG